MNTISPMAYVHPDAKLGEGVIIDPFVSVAGNVEIGDGTHVHSHATIMDGARIGKNCNIYPNAVISCIPQDLKFVGEETTAVIGDNTSVRECATVNRGTKSRGTTIVGSDCLLMAYSHIAHDCVLNNHIIIGNATQIAGEVEVDDWAIISGGTLIHQFTKIGAHVMIQGGWKIYKDIRPYVTAGRDPIAYCGINSVGLKRRGYSNEEIRDIQDIYRYLYLSGMNVSSAVDRILEEVKESKFRDQIVSFVKGSQRGILKGYTD